MLLFCYPKYYNKMLLNDWNISEYHILKSEGSITVLNVCQNQAGFIRKHQKPYVDDQNIHWKYYVKSWNYKVKS